MVWYFKKRVLPTVRVLQAAFGSGLLSTSFQGEYILYDGKIGVEISGKLSGIFLAVLQERGV